MAQLIDGKKLAEDVVSMVKRETEKLVNATGVVPGIAVVIVGEDPASQVYVASKGKRPRNVALFPFSTICRKMRRSRNFSTLSTASTMIQPFMAFWCSCHCQSTSIQVA